MFCFDFVIIFLFYLVVFQILYFHLFFIIFYLFIIIYSYIVMHFFSFPVRVWNPHNEKKLYLYIQYQNKKFQLKSPHIILQTATGALRMNRNVKIILKKHHYVYHKNNCILEQLNVKTTHTLKSNKKLKKNQFTTKKPVNSIEKQFNRSKTKSKKTISKKRVKRNNRNWNRTRVFNKYRCNVSI